jgi:anti-sigma28 factor (negative regulator of flagellin synthesis)
VSGRTTTEFVDNVPQEQTMSSVNNVSNAGPVQKIVAKPVQRELPATATPTRATDRLELSGLSPMLQTLKSTDIRADKVADIRRQIESGSYDADDKKLDAAIDRLLDEVV